MSKMFPIANIATVIKKHLLAGGRATDRVGTELIEKYAASAIKIDEIQSVGRNFGITERHIRTIMTSAIDSALGQSGYNPLIRLPAMSMITASIIFQEPFRLKELLDSIDLVLPEDATEDDRCELLSEASVMYARRIWDLHTQQRGRAEFKPTENGIGLQDADTSGCFTVLVLSGTLLAAVCQLSRAILSF